MAAGAVQGVQGVSAVQGVSCYTGCLLSGPSSGEPGQREVSRRTTAPTQPGGGVFWKDTPSMNM